MERRLVASTIQSITNAATIDLLSKPGQQLLICDFIGPEYAKDLT